MNSKEFRQIGNEFFQKGLFYDALKFYNKALCCKEDYEDVAITLGNRSAVYFELKLYALSLDNITAALPNYPKDKVEKLIERQVKCIQNLPNDGLLHESSLKAAKDFIKLSYPANPKIPYIANCLKLKSDQNFGRGIYAASHNLNPGDIIAIEKISVSHTKDACFERCCFCLKTNHLSLYVLDDSDTNSMYCSLECLYKRLSFTLYLGRNLRILDKILIDLKCPNDYIWKAMEKNNGAEGGRQKIIFDYDWRNLTGRDYDEAFLTCFYGLHSSFGYSPYFNVHLSSILMHNKISLNFYDVRNDGEMTSHQAQCFLLFGSMLNHSCNPNVMHFEFDGSMVFYVAKPIKKGDQLFISYPVDSSFASQNREYRREILKNDFFFDCKCSACKLDYSLIAQTDFLKPKNVKDMTVKEAIKEFKENNNILKTNFTDYRNSRAQYLIQRNVRLMHLVSAYKILPFEN